MNVLEFIKEHKYIIINAIIVFVILAMFAGMAFFMYQMMNKLANQQPQQLPSMNISLDGKPSKVSDPQVIYMQGQSTNTKEIVYSEKQIDPITGQKEKTDVQFDKKDNKVFVKVNGQDYEVPITVTENTKFENGKLVVTETTKTDVNITGPDPSGWKLSYLRDVKGSQGIEVTRGLSKTVSAKALFVQGRDPMLGIEFSLGDLQSKPAPKQAPKQEDIKR